MEGPSVLLHGRGTPFGPVVQPTQCHRIRKRFWQSCTWEDTPAVNMVLGSHVHGKTDAGDDDVDVDVEVYNRSTTGLQQVYNWSTNGLQLVYNPLCGLCDVHDKCCVFPRT